ncbi:hypothetical protein RchiOBHm_Chr6g0312111 [Rosa chinensis]|uniref:Uncharacterized protein n=1 Tax=Rosa chinensis TaxID=74649 RepID=A0A2P6Q1N9_ROSCH|nr:hypothetical protein RchiOBHm_Chr6g0312111 [Rosa chinensis]
MATTIIIDMVTIITQERRKITIIGIQLSPMESTSKTTVEMELMTLMMVMCSMIL